MAETNTVANEDPLIAALPPATDYITYLTLLEYQLNSQNLSTLNRLLTDDDGKLADEIGWDLLRLVLPLLDEVPEDASTCLDIISRRGNPREVVVRIAEELEKLGHSSSHKSEDADSVSPADDDDGLPTFAGEAKRIHLGDMKLDSLPDHEQSQSASVAGVPEQNTQSHNLRTFRALLSMLCTVHVRIKTQYPSRFLATSLPASLGAYRRLSAPPEATQSFLECLKKLSGQQRPPLPPRGPSGPAPVPSAAVPLPDTEAEAEASVGGGARPSENEKAIVTRLLQAVLLEVVDEYFPSLQTENIPSMSWTSRLRDKLEPKRIVLGKQSETELWQSSEELTQRDALAQQAVALAADLNFDLAAALKQAIAPGPRDEGEDVEDDEVSEYPNKPSQIPFTQSAVILLSAAKQFYSTDSSQGPEAQAVAEAFNLITPISDSPVLPNASVQDALHSLLYHVLVSSPTTTWDTATLTHLVFILSQNFNINPFPRLRDDAHHIASTILHNHSDWESHVRIIKQTLRGSVEVTDAKTGTVNVPLSTPFTEGSLKAVGVDWLKKGLLSSGTSDADSRRCTWERDSSIIDTDTELSDLLFPPMQAAPSTAAPDPQAEEQVLLLMPFYISVLNLCCVILASSKSNRDGIPSKSATLLRSIKPWLDHLSQRMTDDENIKQSAPDIFALEDAIKRLTAALEPDEVI